MKQSKPRALALLILVSLLGSASRISASQSNFIALHPGQFQQIEQNLQINVVFVGYQPGNNPRDINEAAFRAVLPQTYHSINREPAFYGIDSPTGLRFTYDYNVVYANASFTDAYFSYLANIAKLGQVTLPQNLYNDQPTRTLTVNQNYKIDATAAEKWLGDHSLSMLGVDPTKYTIFFVNWYGRPDFKFHGYVMPDEPDPDTGVNFAETDLFDFKEFQLSAWGGTAPDDAESGYGTLRRVWFCDLSAGPEFAADSWNIVDADTTGDGQLDYRVAPVWEYGTLMAIDHSTLFHTI